MSVNALDQKTQAVILLARGHTTDQVGEAVGVNGRTVRRWREDAAFEAEVQEARRAMLREAVAALSWAVREAVGVLHRALDDESVTVRVRAASVLLGALPSISEHAELEARIAALEAGLGERRDAA